MGSIGICSRCGGQFALVQTGTDADGHPIFVGRCPQCRNSVILSYGQEAEEKEHPCEPLTKEEREREEWLIANQDMEWEI